MNKPLCRCVRITNATRTIVLGFTDHDMPIDMDIQYLPERAFDPTATETSLNLKIDNLTMTSVIGIDADELKASQLSGGVLDDAEIIVSVIDWTYPPTTIECGKVILSGTIGEISQTSGNFSCEVRATNSSKIATSKVFRLSETCQWEFGSAQCGFDITPFEANVTILNILTAISLQIAETVTDREYDNGTFTFTSGALKGTKYTIAYNIGGTFGFLSPMPKLPLPGDTGVINIGCSKRYDDNLRGCRRWGQQANFGGVPPLSKNFMRGNDYLISPDTVLEED